MSKNEIANLLPDEELALDSSGGLFRNKVYTIGELLALIDSGKLRYINNTLPNWPTRRKEMAIESLLMGIPPSNIVIDGTGETWYVVEGEDYLKVWQNFFANRIVLQDSVLFATKSAEMTFAELPARYHSRFINCKVVCSILSPDCDNFTRMWFYWSTLQQQRSSKKLWDVVSVLFPQEYAQLKTFCQKYGIANEQLFWLYLVGIGMTDKIENPESIFRDNTRADRMLMLLPYDLYSVITLGRVHTLLTTIELNPNLVGVFKAGTDLLDSIDTEIIKKKDKDKRLAVATLFLSWCLGTNRYKHELLTKAVAYFISDTFPIFYNDTLGSYINVTAQIIKQLTDDTHH